MTEAAPSRKVIFAVWPVTPLSSPGLLPPGPRNATRALAPRRAQSVGRAVDDVVETLLERGTEIDLEQQMRAAAQVEAEIDLLLRHEARQLGERVGGEHVRQREDHAERADHHDDDDLPGL